MQAPNASLSSSRIPLRARTNSGSFASSPGSNRRFSITVIRTIAESDSRTGAMANRDRPSLGATQCCTPSPAHRSRRNHSSVGRGAETKVVGHLKLRLFCSKWALRSERTRRVDSDRGRSSRVGRRVLPDRSRQALANSSRPLRSHLDGATWAFLAQIPQPCKVIVELVMRRVSKFDDACPGRRRAVVAFEAVAHDRQRRARQGVFLGEATDDLVEGVLAAGCLEFVRCARGASRNTRC